MHNVTVYVRSMLYITKKQTPQEKDYMKKIIFTATDKLPATLLNRRILKHTHTPNRNA